MLGAQVRRPCRSSALQRKAICKRQVVKICRATVRQAGPTTPPPDYTEIDNQPLNKAIMELFQEKIALTVGENSDLPGYEAITALTRRMHQKAKDLDEIRNGTLTVMRSMFPAWLPPAFKVLFAKPLPELSNKMNAVVTAWTCQWLMGPSKINDVQLDNGQDGKMQGVLVERCRYLESTGCVSVCINSCKIPTQEFFRQDMGLDVTLEPNYDDFSCQFYFGKKPLPPDQDPAMQSPCFAQCPTKRRALEQVDDNCHRIGDPEGMPNPSAAS